MQIIYKAIGGTRVVCPSPGQVVFLPRAALIVSALYEFQSNASEFHVILSNLNYGNGSVMDGKEFLKVSEKYNSNG